MMAEIRREQEKQPANWWDLLASVVFFFAVMTAATRLVATGWVKNLDLIQTGTLLGIFAGLALGRSIFKPLVVFLFSLIYGFYVIPWQLGSTLGVGIEWSVRLTIMVDRIREIILAIILREDVTDNLFFLLLMAIVFWILAIYCGYQLVRNGDTWRTILPAGLTIFIIQNYDPQIARRTWYLAIYILLSLILMARLHFIQQRRRWKTNRTYVPPDAGFDMVRFALLASVVIVIMAWNSPALANSLAPISNFYHLVEKPWLEAKEQMAFLFSSLKATIGFVSDYYGDEQSLGLGNVSEDSPVMQVTAPRLEYPAYRYYWRARVYDTYDNSSWATTFQEQSAFDPESGDISPSDNDKRTLVEVDFTTQKSIITLFSPSQPVWFSRPGNITASQNGDGSLDLMSVESSPFLRPGDTYKAKAYVATFTEKELREAGVNYPDWITSRYLQVPEDITPRTRLLAGRLAEGRDNPYDIASTITFWLRENIEYIEVMEPPPSNRDPIEWFLFDYQKGFCNYYSTSMVMMLRTLGIPARWAVGYAQGQALNPVTPNVPENLRGQLPDFFFEQSRTYQVRQFDAHAWPEVYFPGIGWVEFEPTVSQIPIFRPSGEDFSDTLGGAGINTPERSLEFPALDDLQNLPLDEQPEVNASRPVGLLAAGILLVVLGLGIGFIAIFSRQHPAIMRSFLVRVSQGVKTPVPVHVENGLKGLGFRPPAFIRDLAYRSQLPLVAQYFVEVNHALHRLGIEVGSSVTPAERVTRLNEALPAAQAAAAILLNQYHRQIYSAYLPDETAANRASRTVRELSYQLWRDRLKHRLLHPFGNLSSLFRGSR